MPGILRTIDSVGRIVIPREMLRSLHWQTNDQLLVEVTHTDGEYVLRLTKSTASCYLCGGPLVEGDFVTLCNKPVCSSCIAQLDMLKGDF